MWYFRMTDYRGDGAAFVGKLAEVAAGGRAHPLPRLQGHFPSAWLRVVVRRRDKRSVPARTRVSVPALDPSAKRRHHCQFSGFFSFRFIKIGVF